MPSQPDLPDHSRPRETDVSSSLPMEEGYEAGIPYHPGFEIPLESPSHPRGLSKFFKIFLWIYFYLNPEKGEIGKNCEMKQK